jgi:hypothetical protein
MPKIPVSNVLGIDVDGKLLPDATLQSFLPVLRDWNNLRLDQLPIETASLGFVFDRPIDLGADLSLRIGAGARGGIGIIAAGKRTIDIADPFDSIEAGANEMYLALRLAFTALGGVGFGHFGLGAESEFTVTCYRRFAKGPDGFPSFPKALAAAAESFVLPRGPIDLEQLGPDTVVMLGGRGALSLSASFDAALPVQSLASVSLGVAALEVNAGASIRLDAGVTLAGEYKVRLRHTSAGPVEIGLYREKSRDLMVSVSAAAGIAAKVGGFDLAEQFIGALSRQPLVDKEQFRKALAGPDSDAKEQRIENFEASLKAAIDTRFQVSVSAALSRLRSDEAVLLYEVDPSVAAAAVASALAGDWTGLSVLPSPDGVVQKQNILSRTDVRRQTVKINLLGLANVVSISTITQVSRVERNAAGEITLLVDTSSMNHLRALLVNLRLEPKRLRGLLNENFLLEAAYHASGVGVLPPDFASRHTYLEIHGKTGRAEMKDFLDVARALRTITAEEASARFSDRKDFGPTTFYVETQYRNDAVRRMFLNHSNEARTVAEYEQLGREALGMLLTGDNGQEFRRRVASDTPLWNRMKEIGNRAAFAPLFGLPASALDPRVEAAGSDYFAITSWAAAMHTAGQAVMEADQLLGGAIQVDDSRLDKAREQLKRRLVTVAGASDEHFGDPLGMVMVYLASGRDAAVRIVLEGPEIDRLERAV